MTYCAKYLANLHNLVPKVKHVPYVAEKLKEKNLLVFFRIFKIAKLIFTALAIFLPFH